MPPTAKSLLAAIRTCHHCRHNLTTHSTPHCPQCHHPTDQHLLTLWATTCAAHVLRHFEKHHPHDPRPRRAIAAARAWARGKLSVTDARSAARATHAAARAATHPHAIAAARSAGHAAGTPHVPTHAPAAAYYARKIPPNPLTLHTWQFSRLPHRLHPFINSNPLAARISPR